MGKSKEEPVSEDEWAKVVVPEVFCMVGAQLPQREVCALVCVNKSCRSLLSKHAPLWKVLDLRGAKNAGDRLTRALLLDRYGSVEHINLEFAQDVEDRNLKTLSLKKLRHLNLNACQKITDDGIKAIALSNPQLESISIYWNLKVSDNAVESLLHSCEGLTSLDISGCKNITDASLVCLARYGKQVVNLNLTRCVKLTDHGLLQLLDHCRNLQTLYLYAIPGLTDKSFERFSQLQYLELLDLCGAQNLSDDGLKAVAQCKKLRSLNLTWCVRITDLGLLEIARNKLALQLLSLHGLLGVTDAAIEALSESCAQSLNTLDVNGCVNIQSRSKSDLLQRFPKLTTFTVHS